MSSSELDFAQSVLATAGSGTTHLKLQKLLFYCYGAARAHGEAVPFIRFHNWKHGPVCVEVYEYFSSYGSSSLPQPSGVSSLSGAARDAVRVYGALSAWQLRNESHLEAPWVETSLGQEIPDESIVRHFTAKFRDSIQAPQNLAGSWSLSADQLPALRASSLAKLADALGR